MHEASQSAIDRFAEALWLEDGLSDNTLSAYRRDLSLFASWLFVTHRLALEATQEHHLQAYFAERHGQTKATSANRRLTVFKRFFRWALRERFVQSDPTLRMLAAKQALRTVMLEGSGARDGARDLRRPDGRYESRYEGGSNLEPLREPAAPEPGARHGALLEPTDLLLRAVMSEQDSWLERWRPRWGERRDERWWSRWGERRDGHVYPVGFTACLNDVRVNSVVLEHLVVPMDRATQSVWV
jgi:hypothetical protein